MVRRARGVALRDGQADGDATSLLLVLAVSALYATALRGSVQQRWLPQPRALHPFPDARFAATHPR